MLMCSALLATYVGSRTGQRESGPDVARAKDRTAGPAATNETPGTEGGELPAVEGRYALTKEWTIHLPGRFQRRVEEGDMFLWRPGLTLILAVWNHAADTPSAQLATLKSDLSRDAYDLVEEQQGSVARLAYRLHEAAEDPRQDALYGYVIGKNSYVQLAVYFDHARDAKTASALWRSVSESATAAR